MALFNCTITHKGGFSHNAVAPRLTAKPARLALVSACAAAPKAQDLTQHSSYAVTRRSAGALLAAAALTLLQAGPSSASLLNLPDDVQEKVQEAGRKVPSMSDLAQGDAPTVPGRDFTPPKSLDEQLGAAKSSGKLELPDPLKTMEAPGAGGAIGKQLEKTRAAVQKNFPGPKDLTPGALRDRVVGEALTPQAPSVQMQR